VSFCTPWITHEVNPDRIRESAMKKPRLRTWATTWFSVSARTSVNWLELKYGPSISTGTTVYQLDLRYGSSISTGTTVYHLELRYVFSISTGATVYHLELRYVSSISTDLHIHCYKSVALYAISGIHYHKEHKSFACHLVMNCDGLTKSLNHQELSPESKLQSAPS
jgi:hypothetical protein